MIEGGDLSLMNAVTETLLPSQIELLQTEKGVFVNAKNAVLTATPVVTAEYPGFPTDSQPLLTTKWFPYI